MVDARACVEGPTKCNVVGVLKCCVETSVRKYTDFVKVL
jgi:hypothetical protein